MIRVEILGCGSSGGVPRFGNDWGDCDPHNPKNARLRCAIKVEKINAAGKMTALIDAGPDFRQQVLRANVEMIDALILTHEHADHIHGIDDMRQFVNLKTIEEIELRAQDPSFEMNRDIYHQLVEQSRINCYAGLSCHDDLMKRFGYLFKKAENSLYPPILKMNPIAGPFSITGDAGEIEFTPFAVPHGAIKALGFRFQDIIYLPDVYDLTDEAREIMKNARIWIIDCLQFREHGTHANYEKTMGWIEALKPERAILTNLHTPMDYEKLNAMTPEHIEPAFDGLQIELE